MATLIEAFQTAFEKGKEELNKAVYLEECGSNAGIRKMNANKADWLKYVMYLAELGLEAEKLLIEKEANNELICTDYSNKYQNIIIEKDHRIVELELENKQLIECFGRHLAPYLAEVLKGIGNESK